VTNSDHSVAETKLLKNHSDSVELITAAIVLWNTVYLERAAHALRTGNRMADDGVLQYLSPLGWSIST